MLCHICSGSRDRYTSSRRNMWGTRGQGPADTHAAPSGVKCHRQLHRWLFCLASGIFQAPEYPGWEVGAGVRGRFSRKPAPLVR